MKNLLLTSALFLAIAAQAQLKSLPKPSVNMPADYTKLINKDTKTVMQDLKLSATDTIGKTGTAYFNDVPKVPFKTLKLSSGDVLAFRDDKLSRIVPAAKK